MCLAYILEYTACGDKNIAHLEYGERNGIMAETTVDVYIIFD